MNCVRPFFTPIPALIFFLFSFRLSNVAKCSAPSRIDQYGADFGENTTDCFGTEYSIDYPQFSIKDNCNVSLSITIALSGLYEESDDGSITNIADLNNFERDGYSWSSLNGVVTYFQGYVAFKNEFTSMLEVYQATNDSETDRLTGYVPFNLTTYYFSTSNNASIGLSNLTTFEVPQYTIKFTFSFGAWPFLNLSNKLQLCLVTNVSDNSTNSKSENGGKMRSTSDNNNEILYEFKDGFHLLFPKIVNLDSTYYKLDSSDIEIIDNTGEYSMFCMTFKSFENELVYDPFVYYQKHKSSGGSSSSDEIFVSALIVIGSILGVVLVSVFIVWFVRNRCLGRAEYERMK